MIKEIENIELEIKAQEQKEKQKTGFNTLNTLAQKEFIKLLKDKNSRFKQS